MTTNKCNLTCKHCYQDAGENKSAELTTAEALKLIDEIVPEPLGGAHRDHQLMAMRIKQYLRAQLRELTKIPIDELVEKRYQRFRSYGVFEHDAPALAQAAAQSADPASGEADKPAASEEAPAKEPDAAVKESATKPASSAKGGARKSGASSRGNAKKPDAPSDGKAKDA